MAICIGPVCFPETALISLVLFLAHWLYDKFAGTIRRFVGLGEEATTRAMDERPDDELPPLVDVASTADWEGRVEASAKSGRPLVVEFTAKWCGPCQKIKPLFRRLAATYASAGDFVVVDVDALDDVAEAAAVTMMPTFKVHRGQEILATETGAVPEKLTALVEKIFDEPKKVK